MGIEAVNLYNAGNDAVYTLQTFLKMTVLESREPGKLGKILRKPGESRWTYTTIAYMR